MKESELHKAVADLLDTILLPPAVWTTFPSGWTQMNKGTAGRLKGSGLKAGFPDIIIIFNGRITGVELKTADGRISKAQHLMFLRLHEAGMPVFICRSTDDVIGVLEQASLPHRRAKIAA